MKQIILLIIILVLSGCLAPDRVDISKLNTLHRLLFAEAADREDVETTKHGQPWDWTVRYDRKMSKPGYAKHDFLNGEFYCAIRINPNRLKACDPGGTEQHFIVISQHELRHCSGAQHKNNPDKLMNKNTPCWPVD